MNTEELLSLVKENNNEAFKEILQEYTSMIYSIINEYQLEFGDYQIIKDDLYQEASIALYEACSLYKDDMNTKFSTFAYMIIKRRIIRFYKKSMNKYINESYSIDALDLTDHHQIMSSLCVSDNPVNYQYEQQKLELFSRKNPRLTEQDRKILLMRMNNYSYEEIAKRLNINKKRIDNRLTRLRKKYLHNSEE